MKADCEVCRGACCEGPILIDPDLRAQILATPPESQTRFVADVIRWLTLRDEAGRCRELGEDGRCRIYDTRPVQCQAYEMGGEDCRETIRRRRA